MKRPIEQLIKYDDILCHETRATQDSTGNWWLLHCFLAKNEQSNPCFLMGCEQYTPEFNSARKIAYSPYNSDLSYNKILSNKEYSEKTQYGYLNQLFLCTPNQSDSIFNSSSSTQTSSALDPSVPLDSSIESKMKQRNYEEMVDNTIYSEDAIAKGEVLGGVSSQEAHSFWQDKVHFSHVQELSMIEFLTCFNQYKQFINQEITPQINNESALNVAMQELFGAAYDLQRIKSKIFQPQNDTSEYEHLSTQKQEKTWTEKIKEKLHINE